MNVNAITNHCVTGNCVDQQRGVEKNIESENSVDLSSSTPTVTTKIINIVDSSIIDEKLSSPTLKSFDVISAVLGSDEKNINNNICDESLNDKIKDYNSDCSDDSGHISNENEEITIKMDLKKPRKISEELLEVFEKKLQKQQQQQQQQQPYQAPKTKVIELNHANLIMSSVEIYPSFNKTCKSEVTFYIKKY
jgi:hypothetical protein